MTGTLRAVACIVLAALSAALPAGAGETAGRLFPLVGKENLKLEVPVSWVHEIRQSVRDGTPTILFRSDSPDAILVLVTVIVPSKESINASSDEAIRGQVEQSAKKAERSSMEKKLEVREFRGASGRGYFFFATDPSPRPGTWKYMTQGILRVGELAVSFTILTNEGRKEDEAAAMEMLKGAVHLKYAT